MSEINKKNAIAFYKTAYEGNPSLAVQDICWFGIHSA